MSSGPDEPTTEPIPVMRPPAPQGAEEPTTATQWQQPVSTNFTTAEPAVPVWHQNNQLPAAQDLGLIRRSPPPQHGWRKAVHRMTGGTVNVGESEDQASSRRLTGRVNQPVRGAYSIAVLSLKGGVGKTTTTVALGSTLASIRGDRVIAVDANPDFGTLAQRGPNQTRSTVRHLLADDNLHRYSDVRKHTSQNSSRLEILASERDPAVSEAFSESDYRAVHEVLDRFYNIILTDCGTGLTHSAMKGVLETSDALVLVASPAIDSARSALATLDWLQAHGYANLVPDATVVLSSARPGAVPVDLNRLTQHFHSRVRSVFVVPFDDHLAEGAEVSLELMGRKTRQAFMDLTASVADRFNRGRRAPY